MSITNEMALEIQMQQSQEVITNAEMEADLQENEQRQMLAYKQEVMDQIFGVKR